jgi:bla regulator protein BlaR1
MQSFLWAIVGNTLFAALLAAIVWIASPLLRRRPALVHALWILVLLKLVTPPLFDASPYFDNQPNEPPIPREYASHLAPAITVSESIEDNIFLMEMQLEHARQAKLAAQSPRNWFPSLMIFAWVTGSLVFLGIAAYRAGKFGLLLSNAPIADEKLSLVANEQAQRLGLQKIPTIKVVSACISPLVWQTPGGATIVLPQKLVGELGPDQLRLLLAHELAHVMRGDPLVRWFALGVLTLHWWNPIVWLAVRQIEAAQEACCDSLVLSASGASPKRYAEMLLTTVDFLAGQETPPPALAAGFTSGSSLKGRCEMILSKRTPFALARTTRWMLVVLGLAILPLSTPLMGQEEKKPSSDELAARVERIEKVLEEMKALLTSRADEEKAVRQKLEAANAELAAKMKERQSEAHKLREHIEVARAQAEAQRAEAARELQKLNENVDKKPVEDIAKMQQEIQAKVQAELAKVQQEIARATRDSSDAAAKLAQELAKSHGEDAGKYAEKLSADIAGKIKDQVAHAEKMAREHADHAEKFAKEHAKKFEEHAKHAEEMAKEHAKHAEKFAHEHAKHFQEHAEKMALEAEKHAKMAVESDLPKLKEHLGKMQDQMKREAEKMAKAAEEMSKNPEMIEELGALKEKMEAMKEKMGALREKEMGKLKEHVLREKKRAEESPSDVRRDKVKEEAKSSERKEIEQQLRAREQQIRDLQREVEQLRKELGAGDRRPERNRVKRSVDAREVPLLTKVPYINKLFRDQDIVDAREMIDEVEVELDIEDDLAEAIDVEIEVDMEAEEADVEIELPDIEEKINEKSKREPKEPLSAIEVLKREQLRGDKVNKESTKSADAPVKP